MIGIWKHTHVCNKGFSFIILLQIRQPIELKFSQACYFMHNVGLKWENWTLTILARCPVPLRVINNKNILKDDSFSIWIAALFSSVFVLIIARSVMWDVGGTKHDNSQHDRHNSSHYNKHDRWGRYNWTQDKKRQDW